MNVDPDTLTEIQEYRVTADPILGSDHAATAAGLEDAIYCERGALVDETPSGERVQVATWGELAVLCSTASLTHAAFTNERFLRLFQLALQETTRAMTDGAADADEILPPTVLRLPPTEQTRERAHALREALKRDRDRWFTDAAADLEGDTDGVPAAFWLRGATDTTASAQLAAWYAAGDVSDRLINRLPSLPGQTTTSDRDPIADEAPDDSTSDRDAAQASLNMF